MGNARDAAEERRIRRKGENAKVRAPRRRPSSWRRRKRRPWESIVGLLRYPRNLWRTGPGVKFSSVSRSAGAGHSFFSSQHSTDTGKACVLMVFKVLFVWLDPCRLGLFLAYCAKCSKRANMFPSFSSFPSRQCSASRVLDYLLRFHSLLPKGVPVFQVSSVVENIGNVQRKFHDVIGRMRCGPARRWVQTQLAVRKAGSKRWLRFFNGKRAFGTFDPRIPGTGRMSNLPMRCRLRSLRAAPGVWRLPVWGAG